MQLWQWQDDATPISTRALLHTVFLCILHVITVLVKKTNRNYDQYLDTIHNGPSPLPDIIKSELFLFLAIAVQRGMQMWQYGGLLVENCTPFHGTTMKNNRFLKLFDSYTFQTMTVLLKKIPNYYRLWKQKWCWLLKQCLQKILHSFWIYGCGWSLILFKERADFRQKTKHFWIKIYKLWQDWLHIWHWCLFREEQDMCDCRHGNTCCSKVLDKKCTKSPAQAVHGLLYLPWLIRESE
jgi:hypothetical protein